MMSDCACSVAVQQMAKITNDGEYYEVMANITNMMTSITNDGKHYECSEKVMELPGEVYYLRYSSHS
jgi:hypothetical protein